jgi:hypothetical protein
MDIRFTARTAVGRGALDRLADHACRRLHFRLRHRSDRIARVWVRFGDTGSRRGLRDTYCVMQVQLRDAPAATVMHIGVDAYDTIDRATDRVGQLVEQLLSLADVRRPPSPPAKTMAA